MIHSIVDNVSLSSCITEPMCDYNHRKLYISTPHRYALGQVMTSDNSVVAQLNITRVRVEDGGLYSCTAKEGDYVASHENRLDVYGIVPILFVEITSINKNRLTNFKCCFNATLPKRMSATTPLGLI